MAWRRDQSGTEMGLKTGWGEVLVKILRQVFRYVLGFEYCSLDGRKWSLECFTICWQG